MIERWSWLTSALTQMWLHNGNCSAYLGDLQSPPSFLPDFTAVLSFIGSREKIRGIILMYDTCKIVSQKDLKVRKMWPWKWWVALREQRVYRKMYEWHEIKFIINDVKKMENVWRHIFLPFSPVNTGTKLRSCGTGYISWRLKSMTLQSRSRGKNMRWVERPFC